MEKKSTDPSSYGPWVRTYSKLFSCKSVLVVCTYRAQGKEIYKYRKVSRGSLPRVRRYGLLYLRQSSTTIETFDIISRFCLDSWIKYIHLLILWGFLIMCSWCAVLSQCPDCNLFQGFCCMEITHREMCRVKHELIYIIEYAHHEFFCDLGRFCIHGIFKTVKHDWSDRHGIKATVPIIWLLPLTTAIILILDFPGQIIN